MSRTNLHRTTIGGGGGILSSQLSIKHAHGRGSEKTSRDGATTKRWLSYALETAPPQTGKYHTLHANESLLTKEMNDQKPITI